MTVRVMEGHVLDVLRSLPSNTFQCAATSPPYYGLRDYGLPPQVWGGEQHEHEWGSERFKHSSADSGSGISGTPRLGNEFVASLGQFCACGAWLGSLGLEPTPELYVEHLVSVFREVRRVLRPDGVCWVNLGDSYAGSGKGPSNGLQPGASQIGKSAVRGSDLFECEDCRVVLPLSKLSSGCPQCGQTMVPFGEHADTCQSNHPGEPPWPCTCGLFAAQGRRVGADKSDSNRGSQKYALLNGGRPPAGCKPKDLLGMPWMVAFALRADGWYLRAEIIWSKPNPMPESVTDRPTKAHETVFLLSKSRTYFYDADAIREAHAEFLSTSGKPVPRSRYGGLMPSERNGNSHLQPAVQAKIASGSMNGFAPSDPNPLGRNKRSVWEIATAPFPEAHFATFPPKLVEPMLLAGSRPGDYVLDPFGGAGTTGLVADRLGRDCTLIELNPVYASMARERIASDAPLFVDVA